MNLLKKLFGGSEEETKPRKIAKVVWKTKIRVDHPLSKEIEKYVDGDFKGTRPYSKQYLNELRRNGYAIRDETASVEIRKKKHTTFVGGTADI